MRRAMGICGRKIAEEEFSMDSVISQILNVYHSAAVVEAQVKP
jgi:hypothetical protein